MRVIVITQKDAFFIPRNVELLCVEPGVELLEIVILDARGSLTNKRRDFVRWFGVGAALRLGLRLAASKVRSATARLAAGRRSVSGDLSAVARRHGIALRVERNANAPHLLQHLRELAPDVVVSYSAPQVFGPELLRLPRLGCINLHCSMLPHYRGLLPSFWVLYHGESMAGASVHYMAAGIDDGDILVQREVDISGCRTMFDVLTATKGLGGQLMLEALRGLRDGTLVPVRNIASAGSYFTWPSDEQAREFRRKGYRLV
jgi:methionyl-tRNA formyltransferase